MSIDMLRAHRAREAASSATTTTETLAKACGHHRARIKAARAKGAERQAKREQAARRVWLEDGAVVLSPTEFEACLPPYVREGVPGEPVYYRIREIERPGRRPCTLLDVVKATVRSLVNGYGMDPYHDYAEMLSVGLSRCFFARADGKVIGLRPGQDETAEEAFERYLPAVFYNVVRDHARAMKAAATNPGGVELAARLELVPSPAATPLLEAEWLEECCIVWAEIDRLPGDYAEVFKLRTVDRCPWAEIADYLGVSVAGAFARHERACRLLLGRLSERLHWARDEFLENSGSRAENEPVQPSTECMD